MDDVDVAVVGGGPAGAAVAARLARSGRAVALFERTRYDRPRLGETLPPRVNQGLADLGAMESFLALGPLPSHETASAWGTTAVDTRSHVFDAYGQGWHVDRARFDAMLADHAAEAGATVRSGVDVVGVARGDGWFDVRFDGSSGRETLHAAQVVDATGRTARIARSLGAADRRFDHLVAASVIAALPAGAAAGDTFVEAVEQGWWYVSPLPGRKRIVALFTDAATARSARLGEPAAWWIALQQTIHAVRLARQAMPLTRPSLTSAASHQLTPSAGDGWIAVGDAAVAVDPLASSGVTTALVSARCAADVLLAAASRRAAALADYEAWVTQVAARYAAERIRTYRRERRFSASPFWRARHELVAAGR